MSQKWLDNSSFLVQFSVGNLSYCTVPEGTSGGILKSHHPSITNRVSGIAHKLLKQI